MVRFWKAWSKSTKPRFHSERRKRFFDPAKAAKIVIAGAVEVIDRATNKARPRKLNAKYLDTRSGRVRLAVLPNNSAASLHAFIRRNVKPGTTLLTDGHSAYPGL